VLETLFEAEDLLLAESYVQKKEPLFYLVAYLRALLRSGFIFLEVKPNHLWPHPKNILQKEESSPEAFRALEEALLFFQAPYEIKAPFITQKNERLYLTFVYEKEEKALALFDKLSQTTAPLAPFSDARLLPEQQQAVQGALASSLFCITGGPGTGKTFTAGVFLARFIESCPEHERQALSIALCGPTGKACANLEKSIQKALGALYEKTKNQIVVKTLHALLGKRAYASQEETTAALSFLPYHLIIVDESSMINTSLMLDFLSRCRPLTKVLFLGDPYQLPPVEAGEIFSAFVQRKKQGELVTSMRTDLAAILRLAEAVKKGDAEEVAHLLDSQEEALLFHEVEDSPDAMQAKLGLEKERLACEFATRLKSQKGKNAENRILKNLLGFRLLSPHRKGVWGIEALNALFSFSEEPIIITKNDYELKLMNGQVGLLDHAAKKAFFEEERQEEVRFYPSVLLPQYEKAYALSVHKSQGSEFDHVVLLLTPGCEAFGRKMLYTAITRAKKKVEIWGSKERLLACLTDSPTKGADEQADLSNRNQVQKCSQY
jgi:exodeoxyribonuclease V alpha subunit